MRCLPLGLKLNVSVCTRDAPFLNFSRSAQPRCMKREIGACWKSPALLLLPPDLIERCLAWLNIAALRVKDEFCACLFSASVSWG